MTSLVLLDHVFSAPIYTIPPCSFKPSSCSRIDLPQEMSLITCRQRVHPNLQNDHVRSGITENCDGLLQRRRQGGWSSLYKSQGAIILPSTRTSHLLRYPVPRHQGGSEGCGSHVGALYGMPDFGRSPPRIPPEFLSDPSGAKVVTLL